MPLGLKPSCSVCKANSSAMWRKSSQGEIICNNCAGKSPGPGSVSGLTAGPGSAPAAQQSNGGGSGGGGKQAKQEIHRRSARLRNTKYRSMPPAEKKVSTKGKGRRHIFKLKNPIKAPKSVSTIITSESIFYGGIYYQIGDIVSVVDEDDEKVYYAQIRGFVQDQYCEKSAVITWLIPTQGQRKTYQEKWNILNLFAMLLQNTSNHDRLPFQLFQPDLRKGTSGPVLDQPLQ
ncbi:GATA zinc finger domain-containing protein 1 isoform X2 [Rhincodon typus]|uniref:GATA zinc finger domain-containing protein 1 isoform X2 n=1 Tax=Rhincodon typus TaxID=259920 RepID=UPI00202E83EB|nr:GATA zinc finger domain-containing protein 1 isoform X2 [Rhincodon typus]